MKLCRFDLISSPSVTRSGIVYSGKVYETDGAEPIAVHEVSDARLLSPVGHAPSVRLFAPTASAADWTSLTEGRDAINQLSFSYLNSSIVLGTMSELMPCNFSEDIRFKPCLAAVVKSDATALPAEEADPYIVGVTLMNVFFGADVLRMEQMRGAPMSRSHDMGIGLGPAITTPDELDDATIQDLAGRRYKLNISAYVNDDEVARFDTDDLPFTLTEAVAFASESAAVRAGDVIAICLGEPDLHVSLQSGDEVRLVNDRLGVLVNRVS